MTQAWPSHLVLSSAKSDIAVGGIFFFKITSYLFRQKVLYLPLELGLGGMGHEFSFVNNSSSLFYVVSLTIIINKPY